MRFKIFRQDGAFQSPWSRTERLAFVLWRVVYLLGFRWTPKPFNKWRLFLLKQFGATISGHPYVSGSAIIRIPWHLTMHHRSCLAEHAECYNLADVVLGERCTVSQHVYICTGTHDLSDPELPLMTAPIHVGPDVFVGVRALILPGVVVGAGAVIGAGAVVTKDVEPWMVVGGNPAKMIRRREIHPKTKD